MFATLAVLSTRFLCINATAATVTRYLLLDLMELFRTIALDSHFFPPLFWRNKISVPSVKWTVTSFYYRPNLH